MPPPLRPSSLSSASLKPNNHPPPSHHQQRNPKTLLPSLRNHRNGYLPLQPRGNRFPRPTKIWLHRIPLHERFSLRTRQQRRNRPRISRHVWLRRANYKLHLPRPNTRYALLNPRNDVSHRPPHLLSLPSPNRFRSG